MPGADPIHRAPASAHKACGRSRLFSSISPLPRIFTGGNLRTANSHGCGAVNMLAPKRVSGHGLPMRQTSPSSLPRTATPAAPGPDFRHVRDWIFDLDNTLYRADNGIFAQIDARMTGFVAQLLGMERDAARQIQKQLYRD